MKKIVLVAAAGLLTTATIIAASVNTGKKPETKKEVKKEQVKKSCTKAERRTCIF